MDKKLPVDQSGFRKGRGTRDQFKIDNEKKKSNEYGNILCICFIEYKRAFDCVNHSQLWNKLRMMGIPENITILMKNLYEGQEAIVRTHNGETEGFKVNK